ncbi:hypothetical protein D9M72_575340 [compost metagenome]
MLRRIPLRRQWQGDGEGGAGHAQQHAEQERLFEAVDAQLPGAEQGGDDDHLAEQSGAFRRPAVRQQPHQEAQHRSGKDRSGDHQGAFLGGQLQVGGYLHGQRAEHVPDHEAQVEIEEGGEQSRRVAGFPEACIHRTPHQQRLHARVAALAACSGAAGS